MFFRPIARFFGKKARRVNMTAKRGGVNFYKGNRALPLGQKSSKGAFQLNWDKVPKIVVPDLAGCELKPYVAHPKK